MENRPKWLTQLEVLLLGAVAIISAIVALLDFLGVLGEVAWLSDRVPTLTLLALGMVAAYLVIERRNYLENIQQESNVRIDRLEQGLVDSTRTIINSLDGVELKKFDSGSDVIAYVTKRMSQAKSRIDDLSWSPSISLRNELDATRKVNEKYSDQVARISRKILYREIFMFNRPGRVEKLKQRLEENTEGYSCAYYKSSYIPVLQFMIIDDEEVIFLSDQFRDNFTVRHPEVVTLFSKHYERIWKNAIPLKLGRLILQDEVQKALSDEQQIYASTKHAIYNESINLGVQVGGNVVADAPVENIT